MRPCPGHADWTQSHTQRRQRLALPPGSRLLPARGIRQAAVDRKDPAFGTQGRAGHLVPSSQQRRGKVSLPRRGDGQDAPPRTSSLRWAPSAPCLALSLHTWQGHGLPQPWGSWAAATQCQPRGAQSHIPRCPAPSPASPPTPSSPLQEKPHFTPPPASSPPSLLPHPERLGWGPLSNPRRGFEETGDLHPLCCPPLVPRQGASRGAGPAGHAGPRLQPVPPALQVFLLWEASQQDGLESWSLFPGPLSVSVSVYTLAWGPPWAAARPAPGVVQPPVLEPLSELDSTIPHPTKDHTVK